MAITDAQKAKVSGMCPAAKEVDLGQLIQDAEAGGITAGTGLDITDGVISIADEGVDTTQLAADAVDGTKLADDAVDTEHIADDAVEAAQIADSAVDTDQLADGAVTADKLDSGIALVENPLSGPATGEKLLRKQITLAGANPTSVAIAGADDAATLLGTTHPATFVLTVGNTFIINPNGVGNQTWTVAGTAGTSTGGSTPDTDMSDEPETKLKVAVDGGAAQEFTFDWSAGGGCNTGAKIATQMTTVIQAGGGDFAAVVVTYVGADHYLITSGNKGTASAVVVTPAADHDCSARLKLGTVNGGTEAAGTGDVPILARATAAQCAAKIDALHAQIAAAAEGGYIRINATGTGGSSSLVVGNGTENAVLGFTNTQADYGNVGMGAGHDMANATYTVVLTPVTNDPGAVDVLSVYNKATTGFDIYAETANAIPVEVLVIGALAT